METQGEAKPRDMSGLIDENSVRDQYRWLLDQLAKTRAMLDALGIDSTDKEFGSDNLLTGKYSRMSTKDSIIDILGIKGVTPSNEIFNAYYEDGGKAVKASLRSSLYKGEEFERVAKGYKLRTEDTSTTDEHR